LQKTLGYARRNNKMESVVGEGTSCVIILDFDIIESRTEVLSSEPIYDLGGKLF
jgi:hypothetical protein